MIDSFTSNGKKINIITKDCVVELHNLLSSNYELLESMEPISPAGVKSEALLESAVGRQLTGSGEYYKYNNIFSNAATLTFGIVKNHCFHNGNKRAGFLSLIKHLFVNDYVLVPDLNHKEMYEFIVAVADSAMYHFAYKYSKKYKYLKRHNIKSEEAWTEDHTVGFMTEWIKTNSTPRTISVRGNVKLSLLKRVLSNKGITLEQNGSRIVAYCQKENKFLGINFGRTKMHKREYTIGNSRTEIGRGTLAVLRRDFNLTQAEGVDDNFFYNEDAFLDSEIRAYKKIIYRLSKI